MPDVIFRMQCVSFYAFKDSRHCGKEVLDQMEPLAVAVDWKVSAVEFGNLSAWDTVSERLTQIWWDQLIICHVDYESWHGYLG